MIVCLFALVYNKLKAKKCSGALHSTSENFSKKEASLFPVHTVEQLGGRLLKMVKHFQRRFGICGIFIVSPGFKACYVSGAAVSASSGVPDVG